MSWMNVARGLKVLALVLFLTPWLVVSCQGTPLIEASGMDLISGDLEPPADSPLGGLAALGGGMAWTVSEFKAELRQALNETPAEAPDDQFSQFGQTMAAGLAGAIQIEVKFGYWLALIALGFGAGATFMAMNGAVLPRVTVGPRDG